MKIVRYLDGSAQARYGISRPDGQVDVCDGDPYGGLLPTGEQVPTARLLAPVEPTQILCIGLNYRHHAEETGAKIPERPVLFMKGLNAVQHPGEPILLPTHLPSEEVDYECELAVVIGRSAKNVSRAEAMDYVLGYTCANDVSARDWQKRLGGGQWVRGKTFDTFCPLGPCLVTPDELPNPNNLAIRTIISGEVLQDGNTNDMIFDVAALIEFLSGSTTLLPGTVILTGTPQGVGAARTPPRWLRRGDVVTVEIEGIGSLTNPVTLESAAPG